MTHVSRYRGASPQPLHSPRRQSGQQNQSVRFGGGVLHNTRQSMVNKTLPMFEKMNSVFMWAFLFQDVVALWFTRFYALLTEGRKKYNPKHDPEVKNKSLAQQVWRYTNENLKGLNWQNLWEGIKREFATGPGLLIVPAVTFLLASWSINDAIKMPFRAVKGVGKGLAGNLNGKYENQEAYKGQIADYIKNIFQDPKLMKEKEGELKNWSKKWVDNLYQGNRSDQRKGAEKLAQELEAIIRDFNIEHRLMPYDSVKSGFEKQVERLIKDDHPIHKKLATWISYTPKRLKEVLEKSELSEKEQLRKGARRIQQMPVQDLISDLKHMGGLVKAIEAKGMKKSRPLEEVAEQSMRKIVKWKFGMALAATGITTAYLIKLAFWAQNNNTYQATRFLNEKTAQNQRAQSAALKAHSARAAHSTPDISSIAGSANGLQPVFSNRPTPVNFFNISAAQPNAFNAPQPHGRLPLQTYPEWMNEGRNA